MRFYVPEWEDHVDAEYDFATDEHSTLSRSDRNLAYIWDIFDRSPSETPIDGVLISREQIEESPEQLRTAVLSRLGCEEPFVPEHLAQSVPTEF